MGARITLGIHTPKHAERLSKLLAQEGIEISITPLRLDTVIPGAPVAMELDEEDLPTALRIIENIEIFTLDDEKDPIQVKPRKKAKDLLLGKKQVSEASKGNILVPVDFSDRSLVAARIAFPLAARLNARITLIHAYVLPSAADNFSLSPDTLAFEPRDMELDETIEETARAQMNTFTDKIKELIKAGSVPPVKFSVEIQEGVPETVINEFARENDARLIVMGTRGALKKERELIGSITAEVLDTTRYPVLAIPENDTLRIDKLQEVAFFCNLDNDDITAMNFLHGLLPDSSLHVTFYYIATRRDKFNLINTDESMNKLANYCKAKFKDYTFSTREIQPREAKKMFSGANHAGVDFLVVPNKRRHALARLFNPGLAHRLLFVADIDMLVVPV